ncbi:sulfurtransferase complex subunit TusB [Halomonas sediminis]|uniref:Sulfurtransferase complex subunit TusB n=1 Tax=Vreelandella zhuhanensis TaxID=2684210 RepID=A0A7X3KQ58_9GAMM|nr:sulfurtransferase complex subunit TusB [Halomonas zhuhanensis]MWJ28154.1 sulfurtransferase complex subunit TusB [Halomonas zhuhanensis]
MILHILNRAPASGAVVSQTLRAVSEEDCLLLIEDAVQAIMFPDWEGWQLMKGHIYVLEEDARARGLGDLISPNVSCINVDEFVELTERATQCISWF